MIHFCTEQINENTWLLFFVLLLHLPIFYMAFLHLIDFRNYKKSYERYLKKITEYTNSSEKIIDELVLFISLNQDE